MENDLDQEDDQEQHEPPAALGVIMLENTRNAPLPIHTGVGHHTVLRLLSTRGQLSSSDVCHRECHMSRHKRVICNNLCPDSDMMGESWPHLADTVRCDPGPGPRCDHTDQPPAPGLTPDVPGARGDQGGPGAPPAPLQLGCDRHGFTGSHCVVTLHHSFEDYLWMTKLGFVFCVTGYRLLVF